MKRSSTSNLLTDRLLALGEMVRLRILRVLERHELSVGEVAQVVQLPQSTVSRHLKVLSDGDWLSRRAEGTATLYRLILDELPEPSRALWLTVREQLGGPNGSGATPELAQDIRRLASVLAQRREDSQAFFGRVAGQWDDLRSELFGAAFAPAALLRLLPHDSIVADLGCGTGNLAELLAPAVHAVFAIDQSPAMLAAARKRLAAFKNITLLEGELDRLPLETGSVHFAICALVLHHLDSPHAVQHALAQMHRILKPGGQALIIDMLEHDRESYRHTMGHKWLGFPKPDFTNLMSRAGFKNVRFDDLPPEPGVKGPALFVATGHKL